MFLSSISGILTWFCLSLIYGNSLINGVFSLTYPMQFVAGILIAIFGTGANIKKEKEGNPNVVGSGLVMGMVASAICFVIPVIFVDNYCAYFNFDIEVFRVFTIYSFLFIFLQTLFNILMEKLYFEDKEKLGAIYVLIFNVINVGLIIFISLASKNFLLSSIITLSVLLIFCIIIYIKHFEKFKFTFNILSGMKYASNEIASNVFMFFIYFFGYKTIFEMGSEYMMALNFVSLCTDAQWDCSYAITKAAQVDIAKKRFNYNMSRKTSYIFMAIIIASSFAMFFGLFSVYGVSLKLGLAYLAFQISDMITYPFIQLVRAHVQLEYSPLISTIGKLSTMAIRTVMSIFIFSPFCTDIAQVIAGVLDFLMYLIIRFACYKVVDERLILKKEKKILKDEVVIERVNEETE